MKFTLYEICSATFAASVWTVSYYKLIIRIRVFSVRKHWILYLKALSCLWDLWFYWQILWKLVFLDLMLLVLVGTLSAFLWNVGTNSYLTNCVVSHPRRRRTSELTCAPRSLSAVFSSPSDSGYTLEHPAKDRAFSFPNKISRGLEFSFRPFHVKFLVCKVEPIFIVFQ
jgi:hypothetical protein